MKTSKYSKGLKKKKKKMDFFFIEAVMMSIHNKCWRQNFP